MNNLVKIINYELTIKEFNNQRVVTFRDIDMLHERVEGTARRNFNENKDHFIENEDYFKLTPEQMRCTNFVQQVNPQGITLITESGYLMLVKSLNDDLAWKVQKQLVKSYFRVKETFKNLSPELRAIFAIDIKQQELEGKINVIADDVRTIRETATLTPAHCDMLNKKYRAYIVKMLGGKDSAAYKDHSLRSKIYSDFHREIMEQFGVCSYKSILVRDLDRFIEFIDSYKPEMYLRVAIDGYNNQFKMSV